RIHIAGQIGRTVSHPGVFVDLAAEKLAAVGSLFPQDLRLFQVSAVLEKQRSSFSHGIVFRLMETVAAKITDRAQRPALVSCMNALGGVLDRSEERRVGLV